MDDDKVLELKLSFLTTALSAKFSRLVREIAINNLSEIDDSRVLPLLRDLRFDADSEISAFAVETLRDLEN
jgi:HEAT repeat protein